MNPLPFNPQTDAVLQHHLEAFPVFATGRLDGESDDAFGAALEYARAEGLNSFTMSRVLTLLQARRVVEPDAVRLWLRDGREALGERAVPGLADALVNRELVAHATQTKDWEHAETLAEMQRWFDALNTRFFGGELPPAALSIERSRSGVLGTYRLGRNGYGLKHAINLNSVYTSGSPARRIAILAHEATHLWEDFAHNRRIGGSYHSARFRAKAEEIGVPTDEHGHYLGIVPGSPIARLLERDRVAIPVEDRCAVSVAATGVTQPTPRALPRIKSRSRLAKWTCDCESPPGIWASGGNSLEHAMCTRCNAPLRRAEQG